MMFDKQFSAKAWTWKEVAPPVSTVRPKRFAAIHLLIPFVVAGFLAFGDKLTLAVAVAVIGVVLLVLKVAVPSAHELILRLFAMFGKWVGTVVGHLTLTIVYVIVFTPVALIGRLLRRDPLNLTSRPALTYWSGIPEIDRTRVFDKPFLVETRQTREVSTFKKIFRSGRATYHALLTLFVLNLLCGYLYNGAREMLQPEQLPWQRRASVYGDSEWAEDYYRELIESTRLIYKPFVGWHLNDYSGRYINIKEGLRKTYQASSNSPRALRLYAFGASTMWGWGARDDYTIPSYLAKRAEADGLALEVTNFAGHAYVNWQSVVRLAELCAAGKIPDLVIFYEGAADVIGKIRNPDMDRTHWLQEILAERLTERRTNWPYPPVDLKRWFEKHSLAHIFVRKLGAGLQQRKASRTVWSREEERVRQLAREIVGIYGENAMFVQKLAKNYDFEPFFYWQPVLRTKASPTEEEVAYRKYFDGLFGDVYRAATEEIESLQFMTDISDAFDDLERSIYIDFAHVGELGNQVVADRMYEQIKPILQSFARSKEVEYPEHPRH